MKAVDSVASKPSKRKVSKTESSNDLVLSTKDQLEIRKQSTQKFSLKQLALGGR